MADERATVDFLQAIERVHLKFHTYRTEKVEDTGQYPSLQEFFQSSEHKCNRLQMQRLPPMAPFQSLSGVRG
jgi:hypothetical protein